jgi:hypothetical protein
MSFDEILEELPKLTREEKKQLRELLDSELSWTEEEQAIEEGIGSCEEGQASAGRSSIGKYERNTA